MRAGIALGSNVGDRLDFMRQAGRLLAKQSLDRPVLYSRLYATVPVDMEAGTTEFLNGVIEIGTGVSAADLWRELRTIEETLGRPRHRVKNVSRPIDLDLLYHGDTSLMTGPLLLPHPRLHERAFVLRPLRDIRPDLILPGRRETIAELSANLPAGDGVSLTNFSW